MLAYQPISVPATSEDGSTGVWRLEGSGVQVAASKSSTMVNTDEPLIDLSRAWD